MPTLYQCADPSVTPCIAAGDLSKDPAPPQAIVVLLGTNVSYAAFGRSTRRRTSSARSPRC
jgi:hypothetical protein